MEEEFNLVPPVPRDVYHTLPRRMWKSEELDGKKPTVYDWCRMAAFIDGEGGIQINPYNKPQGRGGARFQVRVLVTNTNPVLPLWLCDTFGGHVITRDNSRNPKWADSYTWSATAARAAWILHNCLPWFLLKKSQAELVLEMQERIDLTVQGRGRSMSDVERAYRVSIKERVNELNLKGRKEKT